MATMRNIQPVNSLWSYPRTLIKHGTIAGMVGCIDLIFSLLTSTLCHRSISKWGESLCLPVAGRISVLGKFFEPLLVLNFWMERKLNFLPTIPINFSPTLTLDREVRNQSSYDQFIIGAFTEEFIFRLGIQKIALLSLGKLLPGRIGKTLSHTISRIFIASLIFASIHTDRTRTYVLPQFIAGLITGIVFEKYGLWASSTTHFVHNSLAAYLLSVFKTN